MKLIISTAILLRHLAPCAEVTNDRSPSAFGKCVLLTAKGTSLTIQAYNQPLSIRATIGGDALTVSMPGSVAVPAAELHDRIKAMKDDTVTLSSDSTKLTIKGSGARKYTLGCFTGEGFPSFPSRPSEEVIVSAESLASVLRRVVYAVHDDLSQAMFCGVTLTAANDTMTANASDGRRLARATSPVTGKINTFIPGPAATTLLSVLEKGDVRVASSTQIVSCTVDGIELVYSLPAGQVPDFDSFFAMLRENDGPRVDRRATIAAVMAITVDGRSGNVPIELASNGSTVALRNMSTTGDESSDEIPCASSFKWTVYAEARYLLEALRSLDGDEVTLCVVEDDMQQPFVLRAGSEIATIGRCSPAKMKEVA